MLHLGKKVKQESAQVILADRFSMCTPSLNISKQAQHFLGWLRESQRACDRQLRLPIESGAADVPGEIGRCDLTSVPCVCVSNEIESEDMRRRKRKEEGERERGCLPRPVLLPYYTQGNNNYTCRTNKAIIIIVAILHSSRSLIVICFRIMPAQCRRQCQSLNSMLFYSPLISRNLVPINSLTKNDQPSDNQKSLVKFPTQEMRYLTQMIWIYSNEPKWTRALSKWRCVQNDEAPGR